MPTEYLPDRHAQNQEDGIGQCGAEFVGSAAMFGRRRSRTFGPHDCGISEDNNADLIVDREATVRGCGLLPRLDGTARGCAPCALRGCTWCAKTKL